jgi:hypothetical protein
MPNLDISIKTRTAMARNLAKFLNEHAKIEIKHTLANKAIAFIFGHNEHSLSALIKNGTNTQPEVAPDGLSSGHKCSAPECKHDATVEVRLFDLYMLADSVKVFDETDITCPYLCDRHLEENESKAVGERKPRGSVKYPFSNRNFAQGFTTYRSLSVKTNSSSGIVESDEIVDFGGGWTLESALARHELVTFLRRKRNTFFIRIGSLKTEIAISLRRERDGIGFTQSHVIKTPRQISPYRTSRPWGDTPGYALLQAITGLTQHYDDAIRNGLPPEEGWLVPY